MAGQTLLRSVAGVIIAATERAAINAVRAVGLTMGSAAAYAPAHSGALRKQELRRKHEAR